MTYPHIQDVPLAELYDRDYLLWVEENLRLLKSGEYEKLDWENFLEEVEDMAQRHKDALESNLIILLWHLLKWKYQPEMKTGSWRGSIVEHRRRILKALKKMPSLKNYLFEVFPEAYQDAIASASAETGLARVTFPSECEWEIEQILELDWFPDRSS